MLAKEFVGNDKQLKLIEDELIASYYRGIDPRTNDSGVDGFDNNLWRRQARFQTYLLPWINRVMPLENLSVADIGCGTGSSTAALARSAKTVIGYEISPGSASVARQRLNALGIHNGSVNVIHPEETISAI